MLWTLLACFEFDPPSLVRDTRYPVGDMVVREVIKRHEGFPDPTFSRTYTLKEGWRLHPIGEYDDEGIAAVDPSRPPTLHGEHIVILSGAHALIHTLSGPTRDVHAYSAPGSQSDTFNGHYDIDARDVILGEEAWTVRFVMRRAPETTALVLSSEDEGETWRRVE